MFILISIGTRTSNPIEFSNSELIRIRQEELKNNLKTTEVPTNKISELEEDFKQLKEGNLEIVAEVTKKLFDKFKEYIIDEYEIDEIRECIKVLLESGQLELFDRLDLVYKYADLYLTDYDKQDVAPVVEVKEDEAKEGEQNEEQAKLENEDKKAEEGEEKEPQVDMRKVQGQGLEVITEKVEEETEIDEGDIIEDSNNPNVQKYSELLQWLEDCIDSIIEECEDDVTSLKGFLKKIFLKTTSIFIVSLKFPHKLGFLSLNSEKRLAKYKDKIVELEEKLKLCILNLKYEGNR